MSSLFCLTSRRHHLCLAPVRTTVCRWTECWAPISISRTGNAYLSASVLGRIVNRKRSRVLRTWLNFRLDIFRHKDLFIVLKYLKSDDSFGDNLLGKKLLIRSSSSKWRRSVCSRPRSFNTSGLVCQVYLCHLRKNGSIPRSPCLKNLKNSLAYPWSNSWKNQGLLPASRRHHGASWVQEHSTLSCTTWWTTTSLLSLPSNSLIDRSSSSSRCFLRLRLIL